MLRIAVALFLLSTAAFGQYTHVFLTVSAPKNWQNNIVDSLTTKLNAIPDVLVAPREHGTAFTISVDVNSVSNGGNDVIGYSMMALIYGTYDRAMMTETFDRLWKGSNANGVPELLRS
jgi:hypothetical protein